MPADTPLTQANADILWMFLAAILVMFMQAGFAMVESGFTRAKNAGNILMKNAFDFSAGSIIFFLFGFAFMFGSDAGGLIGLSGFAGPATPRDPGYFAAITFWLFQAVFAATAATIVSGGIAERTRFSVYLLMSMVVTGLIYPISGHWIWGSLWLGPDSAGWLETLGFTDFAGSTVVHSVGGWVALAGAIVLGPRLGKYGADGRPRAIPGHSIPLAALGVFILWFGWFGFNPGSVGHVDASLGFIAVNTTLAASAGAIGAMGLAWRLFGKPDVSMSLNGILAGLVGITAGCNEVAPLAAIVIGLLAGLLCVGSILFVDRVLHVDDPVGAVSVHGVCGAFGTLALGLFASPDVGSATGLFYGGSIALLGVQALGVLIVFGWAFGAGYAAFRLARAFMGLRVNADDELRGLDIAEHGMESYAGFQIFTNE